MIRDGLAPEPVHNNCSGKHAGMLAACVITGADAESLASTHHPIVRNHHGWAVGEMRPVFRLEKVS